MRSAFALRIISGKNILFVNRENLRIFPIYFFTGGVVEENGICRAAFCESAALWVCPLPREGRLPPAGGRCHRR